MRVIDVMTTEVITVAEEEPLKSAARRMVAAGVSGLPVVDPDGGLVGIITEADFVQRQVSQQEKRRRRLLDAVLHREEAVTDGSTVGDAMTSDPVVVYPEATLTEAARLMLSNQVKRLPVIDETGRLIGIVSRADIMAAFTIPDDVLEEMVREDVIRRVLLLDPDSFSVSVDEGVVTLGGRLPNRNDARLLEELTRRLDGVVRVADELTWELDDTRQPGETASGLP